MGEDHRWLVVGATGLVGADVHRNLVRRGRNVTALTRRPIDGEAVVADLADARAVELAVRRVAPSIVVYCAGATNVDRCELDPTWAQQLNVDAVEHIQRALPPEVLVVYLSTDYIFDGANGPYRETDEPRPLGEYGRSKLRGEAVVALRRAHLTVRTTVVYGWEPLRPPAGSLARIARAGETGTPFDAPVDERGSPTASPDLADAAIELAERGCTGTYHVCGPDRMSRYEFSRTALVKLGHDPALARPVLSAALGRATARPKEHGMLCDKASLALGRAFLSVDEGLARMVEQSPLLAPAP